MNITSAAAIIALSLVLFGMTYYHLTTRSRERLALLEKGLPGDFFKPGMGYLPLVLAAGIVSIGIALGIGVGALLNSMSLSISSGVVFSFTVFLFLGISLVVSFFILRAFSKQG